MRNLNKIAFVIICVLNSSCKNHLPGFDFDSFTNTPVERLAEAVQEEDVETIKELVEKDSLSIDYYDPEYGHSLLMLAVANGLERSVQTLLELGADPNLRSEIKEGVDSSYIDTPMFIAVDNIINRNCDIEILETLIKYQGDVNDKIEIKYIGADYKSYRTPLSEASKGDCLNIIDLLLDSGASLNNYDYVQGHGPLSNAIIHDQMRVLKYLIIDKKAKIPAYVYVRQAHNEKSRQELTITDFLSEKKYPANSEEFRLREEVLNYLRINNLK